MEKKVRVRAMIVYCKPNGIRLRAYFVMTEDRYVGELSVHVKLTETDGDKQITDIRWKCGPCFSVVQAVQ